MSINASSLKPGQELVLTFGAYFPTARALVLGQIETRWGIHVETVAEMSDGDGGVSYERHVVEGHSTELGIGWQLKA